MAEGEIDWERERARAASATQQSLAALARRAGWSVGSARGKGSHILATRDHARPVVIQRKMYRAAALSVIDQLRKGE
ncbi:MAG: type II toxin-antitoxin system HicA family toxin [Dehalococcoidia bacterium]